MNTFASPDKPEADTENSILQKTCRDGLLRLTLNRPHAGNCLSVALLEDLSAEIAAAGDDKTVKAIIIAANGAMYCSGHDLKEMTQRRRDNDKGRAFYHATLTACSTMMQTIVECPKPVIAEIQGHAYAAGAQLVATCDLAVAADAAGFCLPGVNIGLFCSTPMVAVSRNISRKHTMEMLLTGDMIDAERAAELGLINRVVPADKLTQETELLARKIMSKSQPVVKIGKRAFYQQADMDLKSAYEFTTGVMVENMLHAAAEEGIGAFLDKRSPDWPDK